MKYKNRKCFWLQQFSLQLDDCVSSNSKVVKIIGTKFARHLGEMKLRLMEILWDGWTVDVFRGICSITDLPALGFLLKPEIQEWLVESLGKNSCFSEISSSRSIGDFTFFVKFLFLLKCFCLMHIKLPFLRIVLIAKLW